MQNDSTCAPRELGKEKIIDYPKVPNKRGGGPNKQGS